MKLSTRLSDVRLLLLALTGGLLALIGACTNTRVIPAPVAPLPPCPTPAVVSYARDVRPVLVRNCFRCHSAANYIANSRGQLNMEDFGRVQFYASPASGFNGVSYIVGSTERRPGFTVMPYDGAAVDRCDVAILRAWAEAGAPNN